MPPFNVTIAKMVEETPAAALGRANAATDRTAATLAAEDDGTLPASAAATSSSDQCACKLQDAKVRTLETDLVKAQLKIAALQASVERLLAA